MNQLIRFTESAPKQRRTYAEGGLQACIPDHECIDDAFASLQAWNHRPKFQKLTLLIRASTAEKLLEQSLEKYFKII